jgi:hypothetical protein
MGDGQGERGERGEVHHAKNTGRRRLEDDGDAETMDGDSGDFVVAFGCSASGSGEN